MTQAASSRAVTIRPINGQPDRVAIPLLRMNTLRDPFFHQRVVCAYLPLTFKPVSGLFSGLVCFQPPPGAWGLDVCRRAGPPGLHYL